MNQISTIAGDRLCIGCGFNLTGQPIVREETYDLLIARCPECGAVAPLQEYPTLGKWAGRSAALLAGLVTLFLVGMIFIGSLSLYGAARGMSQTANTPIANAIAGAYFEDVLEDVLGGGTINAPSDQAIESYLYQMQDELDGNAPTQRFLGVTPNAQATPTAGRDPATITEEAVTRARSRWVNEWATVDDLWWEQQRRDTYLSEIGGLTGILWQVPPGVWVMLVIIGFIYGMLLAITMLHRKRRWLVVFGIVPIALAAVFMIVWPPQPSTWFRMVGAQAFSLAEVMIWPTIRAAAIIVAYASIAAGLLAGRTLARLLLTLLLPPRLRGALATLWTCDGLPVPRP